MTMQVTHHVFIPDQQMKPGVKLNHMRWAGQYIADTFAGTQNTVRLINAGDAADMPSLSSYDKGKGSMEGRRYKKDIAAADEGFALFEEGLANHKHNQWAPESKDLTLGNHEERILRAIEQDINTLEGVIGLDDLTYANYGWNVHEYLKVIKHDGVMYSHFYQQRGTGKPIGGENIKLRIRKIGGSFVQGHEQTFDFGHVYTSDGRRMCGLVSGAFYLHDEGYLGPQGNAHWRGIHVLHDVRRGEWDHMSVSLDYLCRRYEGKRLSQFLGRH
jgi:hypothetical protein